MAIPNCLQLLISLTTSHRNPNRVLMDVDLFRLLFHSECNSNSLWHVLEVFLVFFFVYTSQDVRLKPYLQSQLKNSRALWNFNSYNLDMIPNHRLCDHQKRLLADHKRSAILKSMNFAILFNSFSCACVYGSIHSFWRFLICIYECCHFSHWRQVIFSYIMLF